MHCGFMGFSLPPIRKEHEMAEFGIVCKWMRYLQLLHIPFNRGLYLPTFSIVHPSKLLFTKNVSLSNWNIVPIFSGPTVFILFKLNYVINICGIISTDVLSKCFEKHCNIRSAWNHVEVLALKLDECSKTFLLSESGWKEFKIYNSLIG